MKRPNIFNFATSELSQDAFITWLIHWANKDLALVDKELYNCAVEFVRSVIGEDQSYEIETIEAGRQWKDIDVWAKVNNDYFIAIEDKKGTTEHSGQLKKYAEFSRSHFKETDMKIILVYFKMEEQGKYSTIEEAGYKNFSRELMMSILEKYENKNTHGNNIILDYYSYLKELDDNINSYKVLPIDKWHRYSWVGFFSNLQRHLNGNWGYVSNASGGFLGFWWYWNNKKLKEDEFNFYLQLEYNKLVFKIESYNPEHRAKLRDYYRSKLYPAARELNISIRQFGRVGRWMGVARLGNDYRQVNKNGTLDFQATVDFLRKIEDLIVVTKKEMTE